MEDSAPAPAGPPLAEPRRVRSVLAAAVALPLLLLLPLAAILAAQVVELLDLTAEVQRADRLVAQARRTEKLLVDQEMGLRGYLLTGAPAFLEPYAEGVAGLPAALAELERLAADRPESDGILELRNGHARWLAWARGALERHARGEDIGSHVAAGEGKRQMGELRAVVDGLVVREERLRDERSLATTRVARRTALLAAGFTLVAGALIGLASRRRLLELSGAYERLLAEQRRHAASLQQRDSLFTAFMDRTPGVAFMKDREGRLLYVNEGMERLFGRSRDELVGRRDEEYLPPEVARQVRENDLAVLDAGRPLQLVETVPAPDGETHRWLVCKFPFRDGAGEPLLGGVAVDVEDRERALAEVRVVNAELERRVALRTAQLTAANRELEAFSYSVSHDLRAPLRAIDGFSRAALEDHGAELGAEGREQLERVCAAARRMSQLIDDLLELSRLTRAEMARVPVDVTALARDVVADLRSTEPDRRVEVAVEEGLRANADPRLVRVLLENLLGNAWKFTSGRAEARIEVGAVGGAEAGVFFVRDNGVGFDTAQAGKLFTPFQRLHSAREFPGTGVGLASVQRVVRRHAGRVWAEAKPGAGAAFYFTLEPELPSRNGGSRASPAAEEPVEGDATLRTFGA